LPVRYNECELGGDGCRDLGHRLTRQKSEQSYETNPRVGSY
jgi:hypothetical protein